jgi:CheY-like chemotaxis protein
LNPPDSRSGAGGSAASATPPAEAPMILVVDDDPDVRDLASTILREAGYRVLEAGTGHHGLKLFEDHPEVDLIFTDLVMPGLDGFMLADMTKFRRPGVKILYATAYIELARDKLGVVHGEILRKPYRAAQLEALVKQTLG